MSYIRQGTTSTDLQGNFETLELKVANNRVLDVSDSINALSDVVIAGASNGQVLTWNGSNWANATPSYEAGSQHLTLAAAGSVADPPSGSVGGTLASGAAWANPTFTDALTSASVGSLTHLALNANRVENTDASAHSALVSFSVDVDIPNGVNLWLGLALFDGVSTYTAQAQATKSVPSWTVERKSVHVEGSCVVSIPAGDFVALRAYHDHGSALNFRNARLDAVLAD